MKKIFTLAVAVLASFSLWAETTYIISGKCNVPLTAGMNGSKYQVLKSNGTTVEATEDISSSITATASFYYNSTSSAIADLTNTANYGTSSSNARTMQSIKILQNEEAVISLGEVQVKQLDVIYVCGSKDPCELTIEGEANATSDQDVHLFTKSSSFGNTISIKNTSTKAKEYRVFVIISIKECNAPEKELVLKADKEAPIYVGDEVTFSTEGGNSNTPAIAGDAGEEINAGKWIATEGKHKFKASQEAAGDVCAQEASLELTVMTKNPVTACTIAGESNGYIGDPYTYTATAANATQYAWFVNGINANTNTAEFTYTPTAAGAYNIVCKARNDFNAAEEWIASNTIELTVTKKVVIMEDTYIWKKGSGYTGCVENPNVDPNANKAETELTYSKASFTGVEKMDRPSSANTEVSLTFTAKEGLYIKSICTYGKLEEPEGAQIAWDGKNWEPLAAYAEGQKSFEAPANTYPASFTIKYVSASTSTGGLYWRNALVSLGEKDEPTALNNTETEIKAVKVIRDGQLYIMYNGKIYNVQGAVVK